MYTLLITFFAVAVCFSFLCSMWEAVLLSVTPSYARVKLDEGEPIGQHLQAFKDNIDRPLAAILTLNTIAHTVGAIGVGNQAALIWAESNPLITGLVVPAVMTLGILVLSEIIPKTLGATYWQELAPFTVRCLRFILMVLGPLVWLSQLITGLLKRGEEKSIFSRTDFVAMAEIGVQEGVIGSGESQFISNLLKFSSVRAQDIMTPRTIVTAAPADMTAREFHESLPDLRFSRVPVLAQAGDKDHVVGYVIKSDVLGQLAEQRDSTPIGELKRNIMLVQQADALPVVFERLMQEREHIALVVDNFGGMAGIVTMEDVIETMLGLEIVDESDHAEDMQALARRNWEERARRMGIEPPAE